MLTPIARAARLFTRTLSRRDPSPIRRSDPLRFRPRVERFEDRWVPAANFWDPVDPMTDTSAWNWQNWSLDRIPTVEDDVYFDGNVSDANCDGFDAVLDWIDMGGELMAVTADHLVGIHLVNGYDGTVQIGGNLTVGELELRTGAINQTSTYGGSATTLSVTDTFNWTGGTLNSGAYLGSLNLKGGATATIDPGVGNTLSTGSNISFENDGNGLGSTGTFNAGTIAFLNNATLTTAVDTVIDIDGTEFANADAAPTPQTLTGTTFVRAAGDKYQMQVINTGTFNIVGGGRADFQFGDATSPSYTQSAGMTQIENGAKLKVQSYAHFSGGKLTTLANNGLTTARIEGNLTNAGAEVLIGSGSNPHAFGILYVTGNVVWDGGVYRPTIDAGNPGVADLWKAGGTFTVTSVMGTPALAPGAVNIPAGGIPGGSNWKIMDSMNGISGTAPTPAGGWCTVSPDPLDLAWYLITP